MKVTNAPRSGGRLIVDSLAINGSDTAYCVPGESYLAVLDAFLDVPAIRVIVCKHEAAAANMADAYGKMTGRPGIAFVTRGPGATHASIGVHTAMQDSTPMILFVGQVAREMQGREAFQEIDIPRVFGGLAKWAAQIDDARRIPEYVSRAFSVATSGRPGPVVLALPEDMLRDRVEVADLDAAATVQAHPAREQISELRTMLAAARRPIAILGGSGWSDAACEQYRRFATRNTLPTACSFRRQSLFDNRDPLYIGDAGVGINPALAARITSADLILAIGGRLGEMPTNGYTLIESPRPKQRLIHVHADANELGRVYQADLAITAGPINFAAALEADGAPTKPAWTAWAADARTDYERNLEPSYSPPLVDLTAVVRYLSTHLPEDAFLCNGAGNHSAWLHRFFQYKRFGTQLAPISGAMGYGVPAAIAAKLRYPEREVVSVAGDGCFLMTGHELATAVQYDARAIFLVVNNGMYATIRMHQERSYPGRVSATEIVNPDFVMLARAYGAYGELIERTEDFPAAFERARNAKAPALLELRVDPDAIAPRTTLSAIRERAQAK